MLLMTELKSPQDAIITPDGRIRYVSEVPRFEEEYLHDTLLRSEGSSMETLIKDGFIRIGIENPTQDGKQVEGILFTGSVDAFRQHSNLVQDIVGRWVIPGGLVTLDDFSKTGDQELRPSQIFDENVGDTFSRLKRSSATFIQRHPKRRVHEVHVRPHRRLR